VTDWLKAKLGRMRMSTVVLIVAFVALFWVNQTFQPRPAEPPAPAPAVVPPGFVPDPNYTWVPRTNVRRTTEPQYTTTTTPTTSPTETTTTSPTLTTTMIDPDGPGPRQATTETITPTTTEAPALIPDVPQLVPPTTTTTPPS
jgi:hypothetical protein